ncbi:MAG: hypothetical protein M1828_001632 [Chrysothrix sp. TS-e1954]|nr:MAG: hypothetical protein M1828_001632 [Chrysothrix sp. TS-e1954]
MRAANAKSNAMQQKARAVPNAPAEVSSVFSLKKRIVECRQPMQDLEKQLSQSKQQNMKLRSLLHIAEEVNVDEPETVSHEDIVTNSKLSFELGGTRKNVRQLSQGVFSRPGIRPSQQVQSKARDIPELPSRDLTESLLGSYFDHFHFNVPIVEWSKMSSEYQYAYDTSQLSHVTQAWIATFFATLAVGTLFNTSMQDQDMRRTSQASDLLNVAIRQIDRREDNITLDHCRAALLISVGLAELNEKASSRTWQAISMSFAVELGLGEQPQHLRREESEARKALWLSVRSNDRFTSLETAKPLHLREDSTVAASELVNLQELSLTHGAGVQSPNVCFAALSTIVPRLQDALKQQRIDPMSLNSINGMISAVTKSHVPESLHPHSSTPLDASLLWLATTINNLRLMLHRHNLSPFSTSGERSVALANCAAAARDTVRAILRSMEVGPDGQQRNCANNALNAYNWRDRMCSFACSSFCTHLWRCALILILTLDFEGALTCVKVSATIGDLRTINNACGRNLAFFLDTFTTRINALSEDWDQLQNDEDTLAFASGDLQGDPAAAWIWESRGSSRSSSHQSPPNSPLTHHQMDNWGGWSRVHSLLTALNDQQRRAQIYNIRGTQPLTPQLQVGASVLSSPSMASPGAPDRISIASIMGSASGARG